MMEHGMARMRMATRMGDARRVFDARTSSRMIMARADTAQHSSRCGVAAAAAVVVVVVFGCLFVNRSDACCMHTRHRSRQGHFSVLAQNSGSSSRAQDNFTA